jgi:hypothetical protein
MVTHKLERPREALARQTARSTSGLTIERQTEGRTKATDSVHAPDAFMRHGRPTAPAERLNAAPPSMPALEHPAPFSFEVANLGLRGLTGGIAVPDGPVPDPDDPPPGPDPSPDPDPGPEPGPGPDPDPDPERGLSSALEGGLSVKFGSSAALSGGRSLR